MSARDFETVRVAVLGLGYWGPNLVRVLHEIPEATPTAVCDLDQTRLQRIGARYPALNLTKTFDEILDDPRIDAIAIATSVSTHYPLALRALDAGKHVFVEKPMAASLEQAEHLATVAAENELTLMPGHTFLYSPPVNLVRDLIQAGELGDIYFISMSRVNLGLHQSDVSVIWDLGPHDFSILRYWLGERPTSVSSVTRSCIIDGIPDVAFISLGYSSNTIAHVELSWLAPSKLRRTAVVGSRKMVVYDDTSNEPVRIFDAGVNLPDPQDFGQYKLSYRTGDIVSPAIMPAEPLALELSDFCRAITEGVEPLSSAAIGMDVIATIEAAEHGAGMGAHLTTGSTW
jgi:predicted dehydrogenase